MSADLLFVRACVASSCTAPYSQIHFFFLLLFEQSDASVWCLRDSVYKGTGNFWVSRVVLYSL